MATFVERIYAKGLQVLDDMRRFFSFNVRPSVHSDQAVELFVYFLCTFVQFKCFLKVSGYSHIVRSFVGVEKCGFTDMKTDRHNTIILSELQCLRSFLQCSRLSLSNISMIFCLKLQTGLADFRLSTA